MYNISRNGADLGRFSATDIEEGIKTGFFTQTDYCWKQGMADWKPLRDEFGTAFAPPEPPPMPRYAAKATPLQGNAQGPLGHTMICKQCGTTGYKVNQPDSSFIPKGSASWWLVMILLFPLSLLIYLYMENKSKETQGCKICGSNSLIPINSPEGRALQARASQV